jgi:general secretion pathway protein K
MRALLLRDTRGWALVSVLWVVSILAMLAAAAQALTLTSYKIEHRAQDAARAQSDLDATVVRAAAGIGDPDFAQRWRIDGISRAFVFDGLQISVSVQDQLGCIDLNGADVSMLRQLIQAGGLQPDAAAALADKMLDWRNPAGLHSLHGATDSDYAAAGYPYRPRHAAYQTVEELRLVMGMTPALFARLAPALTVYTHRPMFDSNTAPRMALLALYAGDSRQADATLAQREAPLPPGNGPSYPPGIASPTMALGGRAFAIEAFVVVRGKRFTRDAVIEMTGDDKRPYFVLAWR